MFPSGPPLSRFCFILLSIYTIDCCTSFSSPSCSLEHTHMRVHLCTHTYTHTHKNTQLCSQGFLVLACDQRLSVFPSLEPVFMTWNAGSFSAHIKKQTKKYMAKEVQILRCDLSLPSPLPSPLVPNGVGLPRAATEAASPAAAWAGSLLQPHLLPPLLRVPSGSPAF